MLSEFMLLELVDYGLLRRFVDYLVASIIDYQNRPPGLPFISYRDVRWQPLKGLRQNAPGRFPLQLGLRASSAADDEYSSTNQ
jgi:hypothetical protein